jgi:hypothetical protein
MQTVLQSDQNPPTLLPAYKQSFSLIKVPQPYFLHTSSSFLVVHYPGLLLTWLLLHRKWADKRALLITIAQKRSRLPRPTVVTADRTYDVPRDVVPWESMDADELEAY